MAEPSLLPIGSHSVLVAGLSVVLPSTHDARFIGPLMFGTLLQFCFYGILVMQGIVFFARQGHGLNDGRLFKLYIGAVLLFTSSQVGFGLWRMFNIAVLLRPWRQLPVAWLELVLNSIVIESVHAFFIFRCYKLSQSKLVLGVILTMLVGQGVAGIVVAVSAANAAELAEIRTTTLAVCSSTLALDAMISGTLFINLWRQKTGQNEVDTIVMRIILMTIQSIVPCVICLAIIVVSVSNLGMLPLGAIWPLALPPITTLYANGLLATLNARPGLRRQLDSDRGNSNGQPSIHMDDIQFSSFNQSYRTSRPTNTTQFTDPVRSGGTGTMSYDIAFTNSNAGGSGLDQIDSKVRPLDPDVDVMPDVGPEHPGTLSSRRTRQASLSSV